MPPLSGRAYELLKVLYDNRGRAVSDHDIESTVWSDYGVGVDGKPMVTDRQLTSLVYQLRERLKPHRDLIYSGAWLRLHARPAPLKPRSRSYCQRPCLSNCATNC